MGAADRLTVIATGAAIAMAVVGGSCSTNARIGDLSARIDEVRTELGARIDEVRTELGARIDRLETRLDEVDGRLRNVEIAFGKVDQRLLTLERVLLPAPTD